MTQNTISGVFAYAKVQEPGKKYQSETEREFSIDVIVDKATFKAFGKSFPKQKGKSMDNDEFAEKYKMEVPFPDQDEQYILKLKKAAQYKSKDTGEFVELPEQYRPKVYQAVNGKAVPLPKEVLIANGSKGKVAYEINENSYGTFAKLKAVLVEDLIKYEKAGSSDSDDFGLPVDTTATPVVTKVVQEEAPKTTTKASAKKAKVVEEDDEDSPF